MTQEEHSLWACNFRKEIEAELARREAHDAEMAAKETVKARRNVRLAREQSGR